MKIIFLCGSLQPGQDGVGDYTSLLASDLLRQGHQTRIISINDKYIKKGIKEVRYENNRAIEVLRLPSIEPWDEKMITAKDFIDEFNPDWVSLQYVPFSFNDKGLPFFLTKQIKKIVDKRPLHIMFHELWGGINNEKHIPVKARILFTLQQICILSFIKKIKPRLITTSIGIYKEKLGGHKAGLLPLFSNIPLTKSSTYVNDKFRVVSFGTFSADKTGLFNQLTWLKQCASVLGKSAEFVHMGNGGPYKEQSLKVINEVFGPDNVQDLGLLSTEEISEGLYRADAGISRADGLLWGKSGTTMAMLEHGLPIVLKGNRDLLKQHLVTLNYEPLLYFCDDLPLIPHKGEPVNALSIIADNMINMYSELTNNFNDNIK